MLKTFRILKHTQAVFLVFKTSNGQVEDFPDLEKCSGSLFSIQDSSNGHVEDFTDLEKCSGSLFSLQDLERPRWRISWT